MTDRCSLRVDGRAHDLTARDAVEPLLHVLRERLGVTTAKEACGHGQCGACTVLIDGAARCACLVPAGAVAGREVTTLAGLEPDPRLAEVQRAFVAEGAVQCGFCTPGLVVAVHDLLRRTPEPSDTEIRAALAGNLCRCTGYGRIVAAVHRAAARSAPGSTSTTHSSVGSAVGDAAPRPDAAAKARGAFEFANDAAVEGMLHGAILRSPHPHARIRSIDTAAALALPGVVCVVTAADVPGDATFGLIVADQPVFARDVVRYAGEPVAAVAADHPTTTRRALGLIAVDYEVLRPVVDPEAAIAGTGATVHPDGDVFRHQQVLHGDPEARGAIAVEGTYELASQDQAFLAPEAALAIPDAAGDAIELLVATQSLHDDRRQIAACLGLPPERVRLTLRGVGGAFGGREEPTVQIPAAVLARRSGRPVRIVSSREDSFLGHPHRHPARIWMRHHADEHGRLVNVEARIVLDGGAYASTSPAVIVNAVTQAHGPYRVPNARIDGWAVRTNNPPNGAMRGFGVPQVCFAYESQMDRLAVACGLDPVEVRRRNLLRAGDALATGQTLTGAVPVAECLDRVAAAPLPPETVTDRRALPGGTGRSADPAHVVRGVGWGLTMKNLMYSEGYDDFVTARCRLHDGVATLTVAACEVGQGFVSVAAQVARSILGDVEVVLDPADTEFGPAGSSSASRLTWMAGAAVAEACREVAARRASGAPAPWEATVEHRHRPTERLDARGQGDVHVAFAFAAHRAVVDVDVELGLVKVVQVAAAHDVGAVVDPLGALGQVEGGVAQGLGLAVMEDLRVEGGVIRNRSFADYLIPTALDAPEVVVALVTEAEPSSPLGVKGLGELPCIPATPAVVAAIRAATGRALTRVPVRAEDLVS